MRNEIMAMECRDSEQSCLFSSKKLTKLKYRKHPFQLKHQLWVNVEFILETSSQNMPTGSEQSSVILGSFSRNHVIGRFGQLNFVTDLFFLQGPRG